MSKVFLVSVGGTTLKISHREIQQRANTECIEYWIILRQHRFIGHVIRMSPYRLPSHLLQGTTARSMVCQGTEEALIQSHHGHA